MRFRKLIAATVLAAALMLTGCRVKYAKIYNPDGTLLTEGEYESCYYGNQVVTIEINGVKYQTAYVNVVTMWWYE